MTEHRRAVLDHLIAHGPLALGGLVTALARPRAEVRDAILALVAGGEIESVGSVEGVRYQATARGRQRGSA